MNEPPSPMQCCAAPTSCGGFRALLRADPTGVRSGFYALFASSGAADEIDPSPRRGLLHLGAAAAELGDAAPQMVWLVEEGEEMHPVLRMALGDSDEVIARVPVAAGSALDGRSVAEAHLELETGFYLLAIRRAGRYVYRPRGPVRLQAGDELFASGPDEGQPLLAELCGSTWLEDDDTGEVELVPAASADPA